jgi:hypothetical protein
MTNREDLLRLAERGEARGADEMIARLEARLEGRPAVGDDLSGTEPARRRVLGRAALVAAAVVLLLGAVALFGPIFEDRSLEQPATVPDESMTTVDAAARDASEAARLAEAYIEALNAYDAAAAGVLLAPDAFVRDSMWSGLDNLELGVEANRVWGWRFEPFECGPNPMRADPGDVLCTYTLQTALHRIAGARPLQSFFDIRVSDGLIVWAHNAFPLGYMDPVWAPMAQWLQARDRYAEARIFYSPNPGVEIVTQILTPEALAEAAALLAAYEQWVSEQ